MDIDGNLWLGAATFATPAPFRVANTGDLDIGGTDASSFHVDSAGNMWWGSGGSAADGSNGATPIGVNGGAGGAGSDGSSTRQVNTTFA